MTAKKPKEPVDAPREEPYHPMAVPEPTTEDRLEAMTIEMKVMKDWINRHNRQHYGRDAL